MNYPADYDRSEPTDVLCDVPIQECGEPLVDFLEVCPSVRLDRPRFDYRRETALRQGVAERLERAAASLRPEGLTIAVLEGWRPPFIQRRMFRAVWDQFKERFPDYDDERLRKVVEQFSAPMDERVPPPHTTGAAIDLWLVDLDGNALDLTSPFEWNDHHGFGFDAEGLSETARRNRDRMGEALEAQGITNYLSEFWHWSYGDQGWAYRGGHPEAIYAAIQPEGWTPDPRDDVEGPLVFLQHEE